MTAVFYVFLAYFGIGTLVGTPLLWICGANEDVLDDFVLCVLIWPLVLFGPKK